MLRPATRAPLAAGLILAGLLAAACSGRIGPPTGGGGPLGKTDHTVTSAAFVSEFKNNGGAAQLKYGGKVIEMTGKVVAVGYDSDGKPQLSFEGHVPGGLEWASCTMKDRFPWTKATPGQTVTVKGRGDRIGIPRLL